MTHFGIFGHDFNTGGFITGTTTNTGQTITGQSVSPQVSLSESFQSSLNIFQNILSGGELPETFRQAIVTTNLLDLGQASKNITDALNEQISIAFDNFLKEDLSTVLQEAMKSSIVETYKAERVKIALQENKNLIRTIVLDVIKELQERNPKKKS